MQAYRINASSDSMRLWQDLHLKYRFLICPCKVKCEVILDSDIDPKKAICELLDFPKQYTVVYKKDLYKSREVDDERRNETQRRNSNKDQKR